MGWVPLAVGSCRQERWGGTPCWTPRSATRGGQVPVSERLGGRVGRGCAPMASPRKAKRGGWSPFSVPCEAGTGGECPVTARPPTEGSRERQPPLCERLRERVGRLCRYVIAWEGDVTGWGAARPDARRESGGMGGARPRSSRASTRCGLYAFCSAPSAAFAEGPARATPGMIHCDVLSSRPAVRAA